MVFGGFFFFLKKVKPNRRIRNVLDFLVYFYSLAAEVYLDSTQLSAHCFCEKLPHAQCSDPAQAY